MKRRVRKDMVENDSQMRLMKYKDSIADSIKELSEETDFSFTQIQNMINDYFFDESKDNVEEVFGELEETDEDEEDEEEESED